MPVDEMNTELRMLTTMCHASGKPHGIELSFMARPLALLTQATFSPASESDAERDREGMRSEQGPEMGAMYSP